MTDPFDSSPESSPRRVPFGAGVSVDVLKKQLKKSRKYAKATNEIAMKSVDAVVQLGLAAETAAKRKVRAPTRLDNLLDTVIEEAEKQNDFDKKLKAAKLASEILLKRGPDPPPPGRDPPPASVSDAQQFNTLRAIFSVARRIYDTKLLPPHSRTLNYSLLKRLLETTALFSNRQVRG